MFDMFTEIRVFFGSEILKIRADSDVLEDSYIILERGWIKKIRI